MTFTDADVAAAARDLLDYRDRPRARAVDGPWRAPPDLATAYRIQFALEDILVAERGYRPIGWKIGATNAGARAGMKLGAPFFGRLFDAMTSASLATLAPAPDFYRAYEAEIVLRIDRDLPAAEGAVDAAVDAAAIAAATGAVLPAIEIVGTCFTPWTAAGGLNLIADAAGHGRWITGGAVADFAGLDLLEAPIALSVDGEVKATGQGRNVEGGAFGATAWLAGALAGYGRRLKAGDYVTTGSVIPPWPVAPGQAVSADFGPLGLVELRVM